MDIHFVKNLYFWNQNLPDYQILSYWSQNNVKFNMIGSRKVFYSENSDFNWMEYSKKFNLLDEIECIRHFYIEKYKKYFSLYLGINENDIDEKLFMMLFNF